ncbi:MAG: hypothetical protein RL071_3769 [Pseudomonadota bacterium]|jgi:peptide/nickel transport system substrate-binding protein
MARRTALLFATLALGAVVGTGSSLSYNEEVLPSTLNPLYASSMSDHRSQELVFDRLYFHDAINNDLKSRVVQKFEMVDDGRGVKLTLVPGIKWHDGKPLTAKDVCFTVDAMLDPKTASPVAEGYRAVLAGCEAQGSQVAKIKFTQVFHNPLERLGFAVLPEAGFTSTAIAPDLEFAAHPIGTGPFKGSKGRRAVTFDVFANTHHAPTIAQLRLNDAGDPQLQVRSIINNGSQGIIAVPPLLRPELSASDDVALKTYDLRSWWFVAVNTNKGPLKDKRVRQALNVSLDRSELRKLAIGTIAGDQTSPCEFISGPFVQASPYYNRAVPVAERSDVKKAEALLTSAGLTKVGGNWSANGQPVQLNIGILAPLNNEAEDLLSQIGNQLSAVGFGRQDQKINEDEWNRRVKAGQANEYDLVVGKWSFGVGDDVNDLFHTRAGREGKLNIFNYSNAQVDGILKEYDAARTDKAAQDAYHKLHATLAEELPYLFLWKLDTRSAWRAEVRNNLISPYYYFTEIDGWKYGR